MYQQQNIDLAKAFIAAQQIKDARQQSKLREMQLNDMQRQQEIQQQRSEVAADLKANPQLLNEAHSAAMGGNPKMLSILQQGAPEEVKSLGSIQNMASDAERKKKIFNLRMQASRQGGAPVSNILAPGALMSPDQARSELERLAPDDPWLAYNNKQREGAIEEQTKRADIAYKGISKEWLEAANRVIGGPLTVDNMNSLTPGQNAQINAIAERLSQKKGTNITLNSGPNGQLLNPLTEGQRSQTQEKLEAARDVLFQVQELRDLGDPRRFLGAQSRIKNWALSKGATVAPKMLDDEQKKLIADARRFNEINYGIFNNMRRIVTGAGASTKELEQLQATIVNTTLDPVSYASALNRLEDFSRRAEATYSKLLRQGVDVNDPGYGEKFDAEMAKSTKTYAQKLAASAAVNGIENLSDEELRRIAGEQ